MYSSGQRGLGATFLNVPSPQPSPDYGRGGKNIQLTKEQKNAVDLISNGNLKLKIKNLKFTKAFGLLEVVISVGILASVLGAAIYANRIMVRNNIIANQRSQAYNLVRGNLEVLRQMRDSTWVDGVQNNWDSYFKDAISSDGQPYHVEFADRQWSIFSGGETNSNELFEGTIFTQEIKFSKVSDPLTEKLQEIGQSTSLNSEDNQSVVVATSVVSWDSYGREYSVTGSVNLTDWKPQN